MPLLSNCCFFLDLKVGSKIIGILTLISGLFSSLALAGVVVMMAFIDVAAKEVKTEINKPHASDDDDYVDLSSEAAKSFINIMLDHISSVAIIAYVLFALCILCVITSSCLIHGIKHNRRGLLIPYIVQEIANVIVIASLDIWCLAVLGTQTEIVSTVLGMLVFMLIHLYFGIVVFSQYQALGLIRMHEEISMK